MTKPCYRCGQVKDEGEFFRSVLTADKLSFHCKECTKKATRVNPNATRNKVAAYTPKTAAHRAVDKALKDGSLTRKPCKICGTQPAVAHHHDYSKPLDVVWLCRHHHSKVHTCDKVDGIDDDLLFALKPETIEPYSNETLNNGQAASV